MLNKQKQKYDLFSLIIIVITIVILAVGALIFGSFTSEFGKDLQSTAQEDYGATADVNASVDFIANDVQKFTDNYFFWFVIALFIGVIMMGLYLEFEPATMVLLFVIGAIVIGASWLGASIYQGFNEEVSNSSVMTKTNVIMDSTYFPVFVFVCLVILVVIMYNRKKDGGIQ
jgi:hypothetical protein